MIKIFSSVVAILFLFNIEVNAQSSVVTFKLQDKDSSEELIGATIRIEKLEKGTSTDLDGVATFTNLDYGSYKFEFSYIGYEEIETTFIIDSKTHEFTVKLERSGEELEEVTVQATRSTRSIKKIPTRIEFIGAEELGEKALMNATNISMVLRESTGIQIQQTSLSSGNRSIRIQGLDGRYTQLLKDGFPLYGGYSGGLSIMQIPPLDLAQFEIIKGSSSTLYGGGAIAGLVNMVSKRPKEDPDLDILLSQTHTGGSTGNIFYSQRKEKIGFTIYGSGHYNSPYDPDDDQFTNIPLTTSFSLNPKLFYYPSQNTTLWFGVNATTDSREGGDISVIKDGVDANHQYFENNNSNRISTQFAYDSKLGENKSIEFKNSFGHFNREIVLPDYIFDGSETNSFTEFNYSSNSKRSDWILGANFYTNSFQENNADNPRDLSQTTAGVFVNNTTDLSDYFILETGFRADYSIDWGVFPLPRLSLLWKTNNSFSARIGGGLGYKVPDLFTEDAATLNFKNILPLNVEELVAEKSYGFNFDFNYSTSLSDNVILSINQLFYNTQISNALLLETNSSSEYSFSNAPKNVQSYGSETNIKLKYKSFRWFINYAFIDTRLKYLTGNPQKPLTPKHNAGTVLMYENEDWRVGYEVYYTGKQNLSNGTLTSDFTTMGLLVQRHFKWGSPFVNFENFTDRRQSRYSPETLGTVQNPIFPELYAPTDGFVFTVGIHFKPFGREEDDDD